MGKARVTSAQSRSTLIGAVSFATSGAMLVRHAATIRAASSAKPWSRVGWPTTCTRRATVAFGSPTSPVVFG